MIVLPDPPPTLPPEPLAFYEALREAVAEIRPTEVDAERAEVDFGDAGVAVTLPHRTQPGWTLAAQVSQRAAVVFAGPASAHFAGGDWPAAAAAFVARVLRGEYEVEVVYRGDTIVRVGNERVFSLASLARRRPERTERVRPSFTRPPP